jgi:N-methylhydantoinase B
VNVRGDRAAFAPRGFYGGSDASLSTFFLEDDSGVMQKIPSKFGGRIKQGRHLLIMTPGGGGFGDKRERTREALERDVVEGKVSAEKTLRDYGVDVTKGAA